MKSTRKIAVLVGVLFLIATMTFMTGSGLIRSFFTDENPNQTSLLSAHCLRSLAAWLLQALEF